MRLIEAESRVNEADKVGEEADLLCLQDLGRRDLQLSTEDAVPETAGDAKAVLVVGKVVLQVVFLELLVVVR